MTLISVRSVWRKWPALGDESALANHYQADSYLIQASQSEYDRSWPLWIARQSHILMLPTLTTSTHIFLNKTISIAVLLLEIGKIAIFIADNVLGYQRQQ